MLVYLFQYQGPDTTMVKKTGIFGMSGCFYVCLSLKGFKKN